MHYISKGDFKTINWLPVDQGVHQSLTVAVFKYVNNECPYYMKEVMKEEYASQGRISSRNNYIRLKSSLLKINRDRRVFHILVSQFRTNYQVQ